MEDKYFYLSHDLVFKYIFGTNANKRFTKRFLELYLDKNIGNIKILNSVKLMPNNIKTRKLEMDVLVYIPKLNTKIIIEMQNILSVETFTKAFLYLSSVIQKEYKSGETEFTKTDTVKEIIVAGHICEHYKDLTNGFLYLINCLSKSIKVLENLMNIDIIDIEKHDVECYNKEVTELEMWYQLINADTKEKLDKIWNNSDNFPLIREVIVEMNKFNKVLYGQEYWLNDFLYKQELNMKFDEGISIGYNNGFAEGKTTGFSEGKISGFSEGINNSKYEIARNLLENTNTSPEEISICTGLSLKDVNKLKNKTSKLMKK